MKVDKIAKLLGHPERAYPTIHVAGTNGKGSVATKIAKALELSGLKVGLNTSPHITTLHERISINGTLITDAEIVAIMEKIFSCGESLTFFELMTLLAFEAFRRARVDIAVIEVGVGGRLDPTNIIHPILSVITSISRDHTAILGATLEEIASEKAGIIKPNVPVVIGPRAHYPCIVEKADTLFIAPHTNGSYDEENQAIARTALEVLKVEPQAIERGIEYRPPCRFERVGNVIYDVAHNPDGFRALCSQLPSKARFLIGMCRDKEIEACLRHVIPHATHIHLVEVSSPRTATTQELAAILDRLGFKNYSFGKPEQNGELLVVCGSFYLMKK